MMVVIIAAFRNSLKKGEKEESGCGRLISRIL
jgi:hypothetical protein